MKRVTYTVIVEQAGGNFSGYVPDLPGCVATGETEEAVVENLREAMRWHIEGMVEDNQPVPPPRVTSRQIEVEPAA